MQCQMKLEMKDNIYNIYHFTKYNEKIKRIKNKEKNQYHKNIQTIILTDGYNNGLY